MYVIALGIIKEAIADYKRKTNDNKENNREACRVIAKGGSFETQRMRTKDIQVGDVIRIKDNDFIPADCIVVS